MSKSFKAVGEREAMSRFRYLNIIIDYLLESNDKAICLLEDVDGSEINSENIGTVYSSLYLLVKEKPLIVTRRKNKLFLVKERA